MQVDELLELGVKVAIYSGQVILFTTGYHIILNKCSATKTGLIDTQIYHQSCTVTVLGKINALLKRNSLFEFLTKPILTSDL
jgi:hypothetical protein